MRLSNLSAALWNRLPLPFDRMAAGVADGPRPPGEPLPLNKICDRRDWDDPAWRATFEELGFRFSPETLHRKQWEFTQGVFGLRRLGCLAPEAEALGLGSGHEPIIFFLARRLARVVATDLYEGDFSGHEAHPRMLTRPDLFAPIAYPFDRLEVRVMDGTRIDYPDERFDLVFSFSSIEHFGSRRDQLRTLTETARVLRPGGVAVFTTELILNAHGRHGEFFRRDMLLDRLVKRSGLRLAGGPFDFSIGRQTLDTIQTVSGAGRPGPHLVLRRWRTLFTSCSLFLEKPIPPGTPGARLARRGAERPADLPPLLAATITLSAPPPVAVGAGSALELSCTVENTGAATWEQKATDGVGLVRLGAHLRAASGEMVRLDYGRAELPRDLPPGGRGAVQLRVQAPERPGRYLVELDMVREGVAWFSDQEVSSSVSFPLEVAAG